jgi:hypothetical protein
MKKPIGKLTLLQMGQARFMSFSLYAKKVSYFRETHMPVNSHRLFVSPLKTNISNFSPTL